MDERSRPPTSLYTNGLYITVAVFDYGSEVSHVF